ncbi:MAG: SMR family transporter, partial [Roseomonas mucosa]|nr:SMR family transporter [Roseomonas mucosa]
MSSGGPCRGMSSKRWRPADAMRPYLFLLVAICGEVAGTLSLKASDGFTRLWPSVFTMLCYVLTF